MATSITTITNISSQVIPILVNPIAVDKASVNSDLPPDDARQLQIPAGSSTRIETARLDAGQLDQLRRKRLLTYSVA